MVLRRNFSTNVIPQDLQDPYFLEMHRKAVMSSMYGMNNVIKVDLQQNKVKFLLNTTGVAYDSMQEAFEEAGKSGITTFARLTGRMNTSSANLRGLEGLSQRLIDMQTNLSVADARRLGISDPSKLFFEVGSFKMPRGQKQATKNIVDNFKNGIIVPDDGSFNILRVFEGTAGQNPIEISTEQISRLFMATSGGVGGILSTSELTAALLNEKDPQGKLGSLFQKVGKRIKGVIALKDVSLTGENLSSLLESLGTGQTSLNDKTVRVFDPGKELKMIAERYLSDPSKKEEGYLLGAFDSMGTVVSEELKDFYRGTGAIESVIERLNRLNITKLSDLAEGSEKAEAFISATDSAYDGTSVINSKVSNAMKKQLQKELNELTNEVSRGIVNEQSLDRIRALQSQLSNMGSGLEATTGRVFMTIGGEARNIKAVFDSAGFRSSLENYAILTTKAVLKRETALMGQTESINLVLQGDPSPLVYQDPLMPSFHQSVYNESFEESQRLRTQRIISEYRDAVETGKISKQLKTRIFKDAEMDLTGLPEAVRNQQSRNRIFAQRLKQAIEAGVDIRTMPQLLNYLKNHTESKLYREVDGMFQPALEDAFRFAIDTQESFYAGRSVANRGRLLSATENVELANGKVIRAATFQIQGHKMLLGGDAASIFKHSLGGFDLDDHGIVMPRIFKDASGNDRLGTFIFRQPTGPSEFVFGKANFGNTDTIRAFLGEQDFFSSALDELIAESAQDENKKQVYSLLKNALDPENRTGADAFLSEFNFNNPDQLEQGIIQVMRRSEKFGYKAQTIDAVKLFEGLETGSYGAGISFNEKTLQRLIDSGLGINEEKYLVDQYSQGLIRRAFIEEGAFGIDNNFKAAIKSAIGESLYNSQLSNIENNQKAYLNRLGSLMDSGGPLLRENIQAAIESDWSQKAREATKNADSIGTYINRLTIASASSDQESAIMKALEGKVDARILEDLNKKYIMAVAPSDIVDQIVNLNSRTGTVGLANSAEVMRAMYQGSTNEESVQRAIARIMGIKDLNDVSIVDALGRDMIQAKGERIGALRALAMRNLDEASRKDLMAGIDEEFLRQRLSSGDASSFIKGMQEEYKRVYADLLGEKGEFATGTDQALIDDYNQLMRLSEASTPKLQEENLKKFIGLGEDSNYAPLSKAARIGRESKQAMDAEVARFASRRTTAFASEINMSADAMQLSENILNSYASMLKDNYDNLNSLASNSEDVSEFFTSNKAATLMEINDKVYSMIYKAAELNEGVTVGQLADNMEFMMHSRYPRLRSLMTAQMFGDRENTIIDMFFGAQQQRLLRDAKRRGVKTELLDQYNTMVDSINANNSTRQKVLEELRQRHESFKAISTASNLSDESLTTAAAVYRFDEAKDFSALGLSEENERAVRNFIAQADAKRYLDSSGIEELLNFGKASEASRFAPSDIGRSMSEDDLRAVTLGDDAVDSSVTNPSTYRRITDNWKQSKLYEAFGDPIVKKSSYALVGLIAASLLYSGAKDRSQDDMSGPPLLPGGSAYESMIQREPSVPNVSMFSGYNQGTSYSVNIEGSQSQIDSFSSVAGGNGSSTIYRGLPQLGRDPYPELAGSI